MKPRDKELKAILRDHPEDVDARRELVRYWMDRGRYGEAERTLDDGLKRTPNAVGLLESRADLLISTGRDDEAAAAVDAAVAAGLSAELASILRAVLCSNRKDWAGVFEHLLPLVEQQPDVVDHRLLLARASIETGDATSAERHIAHVLRVAPDNCDGHLLMAEALVAQGRFDRASYHTDRALEIEPGSEAAMFVKVACLRNTKDPQEAARWLQEWLDNYSRSIAGHFLLAELYDHAGFLGSAIDVGRRFVRLSPNDARPRLDLAARLMRAGHRDEAADQARRALASEPNSIEARLLLASIAFRQDRYEEMELHLRGAERIEGHGRESDVITMRGQLAMSQRKLEKAESHFNEAVRIDAGNCTAWAGLAATLERLERFPEALEAIQKAVEIEPEQPVFRLQRADLFQKLGRKDEAEAELKTLESMRRSLSGA